MGGVDQEEEMKDCIQSSLHMTKETKVEVSWIAISDGSERKFVLVRFGEIMNGVSLFLPFNQEGVEVLRGIKGEIDKFLDQNTAETICDRAEEVAS